MIGRQMSGGDGGLDLLAVQRDDELLDLLAARVELSADVELMRMLAAWRDELDEGLAELLGALPPTSASPSAAPGADVLPDAVADMADAAVPRRHRFTAAGTAAALVIGGTLSLSGVAAAVTGDPLAPYRAVGEALSFGGGDDLPPNASEVARLNRHLRGARAALAHGDTEAVARLVDQLTAQLATSDLTDKQRSALAHRLAALRAALDRAAAHPERGHSEGRASAVATPTPEQKPADTGEPDSSNESPQDGQEQPATQPADRSQGGERQDHGGTDQQPTTTDDDDGDSDGGDQAPADRTGPAERTGPADATDPDEGTGPADGTRPADRGPGGDAQGPGAGEQGDSTEARESGSGAANSNAAAARADVVQGAPSGVVAPGVDATANPGRSEPRR